MKDSYLIFSIYAAIAIIIITLSGCVTLNFKPYHATEFLSKYCDVVPRTAPMSDEEAVRVSPPHIVVLHNTGNTLAEMCENAGAAGCTITEWDPRLPGTIKTIHIMKPKSWADECAIFTAGHEYMHLIGEDHE